MDGPYGWLLTTSWATAPFPPQGRQGADDPTMGCGNSTPGKTDQPTHATSETPRKAGGASAAAPAPSSSPEFLVPIEPAFDAWLHAQLAASPADIKDTDEFRYITFTELPPFTDKHKSLMRKTLTPELWAALKDKKSSKGYTLSNAIQAGVVRPHLGVGITCGDEECFELFKDIIYPVVQGWHKFDPYTQVHKSDLDPSKLAFSAEQAEKFNKYVVSTRIRAARNIAGFSLPAGSTKADRAGVESVLKQAFGSLPSELSGTYYPLGSLTSEQESSLQEGGFLFQKPGPKQLLGAAGAGRDWPEGRGIFHNASKTVLAWCNEEDHCRIISMENGGDIKGVFTRFCQLSHAIKAASEANGKSLMYNDQLGFLGTCPSNLGTGLRASVMVCLPHLNKDVHKLEEVCNSLDLQPRGSAGEHSEAVGAKWDVSNKQRLGFTEVELVQKLIDGITKLLAIEEEMAAAAPAPSSSPEFLVPIEPAFDAWLHAQLAASPADIKDTDEFRYITFTELPPFTDKHKSLMRKTLTPELWAALKDKKSSKGYTLSNAIQAGVVRPHLGVGITCGDEECFELFKDIIYPVVQGWHKFDPYTQVHKSDLDPSKLAFSSEQVEKFNKYVVSTRIRAARNIAGFSLPAGSTKADRAGVESVLKQAFGSLPSELSGTYYPLGSLTSEQESSLQEGGFLFQKPGPKQLLGAAGAGRDWPEGRGIFHNASKTVLAWCNEEDHCRIISMENGGDIKDVFTRFCQLSHAIKAASEANGKSLMYNDQLGFLGTCPSNLGTGLRASVMVCLPHLNKDVHKLEEVCNSLDLQPRGSAGEHSEAVGAKWDVSNKQRLGFTEVELVQKLIDGITKLLAIEEEMAAAAPAPSSTPEFLVPIEPAFDAWLHAQLAASPADIKDTDEFRYITFTELPPFTDKHKSLMRKTLTPELWAALKDKKSSKGYTLSNAIQAGVVRPHLGVGITCGDEECFELFKDIIYPVVQGWHKFDPYTQVHKSDLDPSKLAFSSEQVEKFNKYVVSTRIRAARNIAGFSLPAGSTKADRAGVESVLKQAFGSLPSELSGTYYPLGSLTSEQESSLQEGGFLFQKPGPKQLLGAAGAGRDWPEGRGIFHNASKTVLAWCNEEDHCRIISMENGGDIKDVFTRFCQLSHAIKAASEANGKSLMYNDQLGFLGTCPSNLGTGLRASVMVCLPHLNKDVHKLEEVCNSLDLQPRGSAGEHSEAVGAKWDVSNKQRLGFTEVELVQKLIDGITKLLAIEEEMAAAAQ